MNTMELAFAKDPGLKQRIDKVIGEDMETVIEALQDRSADHCPAQQQELKSLFEDIADFIHSLTVKDHAYSPANAGSSEIISKKRKVENSAETSHLNERRDEDTWPTSKVNAFPDISFQIPQRKKLRLEVSSDRRHGFRAVAEDRNVESMVRWDKVRMAAMLPVPEKAQVQHNVCIFHETEASQSTGSADQVLFTISDGPPKLVQLNDNYDASMSFRELMTDIINEGLKSYQKRVVRPEAEEFVSPIVQPHRKHEPAYHIKAFRGAKEGYLFLLSSGIVWGFRKPLEFFALEDIESVSFDSILQHTFDLTIAVRHPEDGMKTEHAQEYKFSMIDQALYAGIDKYVKRHDLPDASMAEQRKAKRAHINGSGRGARRQDGDTGADDPDAAGLDIKQEDEGELAKAVRLVEQGGLQQQTGAHNGIKDEDSDDDEEDENFDPGSEGQSEGEGDSTSEDRDPGNSP